MNTVVLDTSFLAHALVPSQQTPESAEALVRLIASDDNIVIPAPLIVEFGSLVRKAANLGRVSVVEAQEIFSYVFDLKAIMDVTPGLLSRGYEIAEKLSQSDTFDSTGYVLAEAVGGEFWTADRRFANAARAAGLSAVRYVR